MRTHAAEAAPRHGADAGPRRRARGWGKALTFAGWTLIAAGAVVLLYLVYSLFYTNLSTEAAQASLLEEWDRQVDGEPPGPSPAGAPAPSSVPAPADPVPVATATPAPATAGPASSPPVTEAPVVGDSDPPDVAGEAVALLRFVRPGAAPPVHAEPLVVLQGVGTGDLKRGPGHYPGTAMPGEDGNFAVAGHRTTYGAPFFHLDELQEGDEIHVTDRSGRRFVYRFVRQRIVAPGDLWVIGHDPFGTGTPTLTLTTCHPRFSAQQRLVAFAQLVEDGPP